MSRPVTLLHLSDIQFGQHHRFGSGDDVDTLYRRLEEDLRGLAARHDLRPDLVVVTGDLAERGLPSEFTQAREFLGRLASYLRIGHDHIAIIPGNHDVNRAACEAYFNKCAADEEDPIAPYWPKWAHYAESFHSLYRDVSSFVFTENKPWSLFSFNDLRLVIAGLNSTMAESHLNGHHYGAVGEQQLRWFRDQLEDYRNRGWLRLGIIHHNVVRKAVNDDENLQDADDLERELGGALNLILHGHTHDGKLYWTSQRVPILSTGSAALSKEALPHEGEVPNQYQIVRIEVDSFCRWCRQYAPDRKKWQGDNRTSDSGDEWWDRRKISPEEVWGTFPQDEFIDRVEAVCRLRVEKDAEISSQIGPLSIGYLRVTEKRGTFVRHYPIGTLPGVVDNTALDDFLAIHHQYQSTDSGVISTLVYGGARPEADIMEIAAAERIDLQSFVEYQGLIDFRSYVEQQTRRLETDGTYVPDSYVPQKIEYRHSGKKKEGDAIETVSRWLTDIYGRFVLVLGDFGTGKTFLLREIARRIGRMKSSPLVPVLIEMHDLEKGRTLNQLIAQHLADAGVDRIDLNAFRYMLREGRIALLFDGFDELALRVSYDRAVEHFATLYEAARGKAKVVVTSRTQHFESDQQVRTGLGEQVDLLPGRRITYLQGFDESQIRHFLVNQLNDETEANERLVLLNEVKDLMGLSANPRMLSFISKLPAEELRKAGSKSDEVTAASLYNILLDWWLEFEIGRQQPAGAPPALNVDQRWIAVTHLAMTLWGRAQRSMDLKELNLEVQKVVTLGDEQNLSPEEIAHQVGSGTLLIRDEEGKFSFIHQSVLEWLVARQAAREVGSSVTVGGLEIRDISPLIADFFCDLADEEKTSAWAARILKDEGAGVARRNALLVRERLGETTQEPLTLRDEDVRGRDFSGQILEDTDFSLSDLTSATFVKSNLTRARLRNARLVRADLTEADLRDADLREADFSEARLLGANLCGAKHEGAVFHRTKLVGAKHLDVPPERYRGSAPPKPSIAEVVPWSSSFSEYRSVAWSPAQTYLAAGHHDGTIRLWDTENGHEIRRLLGHQHSVTSVCFNPAGSLLASGSSDKTVRLWDVASGQEKDVLNGHTSWITSVCFNNNGSLLASGADDKTVRLWDVASGQEVDKLRGSPHSVRAVCFSSRGPLLAYGSDDNKVRLWNVESKQETVLEGHQYAVTSVCFHPHGSLLASASFDRTVRLWDVDSGKEKKVLKGHQFSVTTLSFHPEGAMLASGSDDSTVRLWNVGSGEVEKDLRGHQAKVRGVAFNPQGSLLASGSDNTMRLWNVESGQQKERENLEKARNGVRSVFFSHEGPLLALGLDDNTVRLWDTALGAEAKTLRGHQNSVMSVCFSLDRSFLASGSADNTVRLWDVASGQERRIFQGHRNWVQHVIFSRDGSLLASGSDDQTLRLWDLTSGEEERILQGHQGSVQSVCFSPDGSLLASGSRDRTVRLWDVSSGQEEKVFSGNQFWFSSVCFSPEGELLLAAGAADRTVRLWEVDSNREREPLRGHRDVVTSVCFSPGGSSILASGSDDKTVRLWDVDSGREKRTLSGHQNSITSVYFSGDGSFLASGSSDNTVRLWDVPSGHCLAVLVSLPEGWVAYTPEGRYKLGGETSGGFWHSIGLCRFEPGELDPYLDEPLRVPDGEPLVPELAS